MHLGSFRPSQHSSGLAEGRRVRSQQLTAVVARQSAAVAGVIAAFVTVESSVEPPCSRNLPDVKFVVALRCLLLSFHS